MSGKGRPSRLYIVFLAAMLLLIAIGAFMLIWGSAHNAVPTPTLRGPGMFAWGGFHA